MADEKKETPAQATADAGAAKKEEKKVEAVAEVVQNKPTGLDGMTKEQLREIYKKTPEIFEGIVPEKKEAPPAEKKEEPKPEPKSAAPSYEGQEINLPKDVPVNTDLVNDYLKFAKENGLSPKVVQAQIDWQANQARAYAKSQKTPETEAAEKDAANVSVLKKEFGEKYEENMNVARLAAAEFADPEMLEKLKTSDPVLVKHFLKLGKKNGEDTTKNGTSRTGDETANAEKAQQDHLKNRYKNTPQLFQE